LLRMQLEIEVEHLLEKIADGSRAVVERDRLLADHERRVDEAGVGRSGGFLIVGMQRVRLDDADEEPAVRLRSRLERHLLVANPLAARRRLRSRRSWRLTCLECASAARRQPGRCRRLWASALREAPRQRKVAKLVEIE